MSKKGVFEGVKVAEFSSAVVGPLCGKYLADYGATAVRIESHRRVDILRVSSPYKGSTPHVDGSAFFSNFNTSRYSAALDLSKPKGREIAWRFVKWADIMIENFSPGVASAWGLEYENVRKVRPDIIYLSSSVNGSYGPHARYKAFGTLATPLAAMGHIIGWPDRPPSLPFDAYSDFLSPRLGATALLAALLYRQRTGNGVYLEQSQTESNLQFMAPPIMDYIINGRIINRNGNRLPYAAPHGVYPCQGDDRWVAISVFTDEEWRGFCQVLREPQWTKRPEFATLSGRKEEEDELDKIIAEWTIKHTAEQVEELMQAAGIAASVVETNQDIFEDPQVKERGYFRLLNHSYMGPHPCGGPSFRLSKTPDQQFGAPCLGEHSEYVYKELLGMSDEEIAELLIEGVITTEADLPQLRPGF